MNISGAAEKRNMAARIGSFEWLVVFGTIFYLSKYVVGKLQ